MKHALKCAVFAVAILVSSNAYAASELEALKNQVQQLMDRIEQLEADKKSAPAVEPQAEVTEQAEAPAPSTEVRKSARAATAENTGNPSISVLGNFNAQRIRGSGGVRSSSFLPLSEAEIIFGANIDAYARLDMTVTAANGGMAVEEGFITAYLPWGVNMRAGRKFLPIGRVNEMHPHALIYADRPNGLVNLFGPEIFIGNGVLLDRPFFIGDSVQTLTGGFFSTENDVAFDPTGTSQYAGLARWTGLWDIGDSATFELGANYVQGKNGIATMDSMTRIGGGHFALKYQNLSHAGFSLEGEWFRRWQEQGTGIATAKTDGAYLLATAAINRNWHLFSRYDLSRDYNAATASWVNEKAISAGAAWKISEFQSITLQYKNTRKALAEVAGDLGIAAGGDANAWYLRWVVAIGPHGAHPY